MTCHYRCYFCGNEEEIQYPSGPVVCPLCGHTMVFTGTESDT